MLFKPSSDQTGGRSISQICGGRYHRSVVDDIADLLWKISQICGGRYRRSVPAVEVFSNNSVADITIENNYFLNQALMGC